MFLILGAVKEEVWAAPEDSGKAKRETPILQLNERKRF
jgi:hypothetical protein